jgi:SNF2 family DNA or RNA helicase
MTQKKKKKKTIKRSRARQSKHKKQTVTDEDFKRIEFHRHAVALLPESEDRMPGVAIFVEGKKRDPYASNWRFCSCNPFRNRTCPHILKLTEILKILRKTLDHGSLHEDFKSSIWFRLAAILGEHSRITPQSVHTQALFYIDDNQSRDLEDLNETGGNRNYIKISDQDGEEMLSYFSRGADTFRLLNRLSKVNEVDEVNNRAAVIEKLSLLTLTENERIVLEKGYKTRGQTLEQSFWYRLAYHCYQEFGPAGCAFHPSIEETSGTFAVSCKKVDGELVFRIPIPRHLVRNLLNLLSERSPGPHNMAIHPVPLKSIYKATINRKMNMEFQPLIRFVKENGEEMLFKQEDIKLFCYGDLVYIRELCIMAELERPGKDQRFKFSTKTRLKKSEVPVFLDEFGEELFTGPHIVDEKIKSFKIYKDYDSVKITPEALDRDWCWLDVNYGFGNTSLSLRDILSARKKGRRFIATQEGWVDCLSQELESIAWSFPEIKFDSTSDHMKLSRMDLFRIKATSTKPLEIDGDSERVTSINRMLQLKPSIVLPPLKEMRSTLRHYQILGVEWILFLFENGLGGLLCDDMGLGKTHQAMAFMLILKRFKNFKTPCLVVSPTTVLSHWQNKIREHIPVLTATEYHGGQRDLVDALTNSDILLTSYGIIRRDIEQLKHQEFLLVIFDEIQHLKNPQTQTYKAAREINAGMKLGLTGTPIENSLTDLKALMDLTLPGYLGSDDDFIRQYVNPNQPELSSKKRKELIRLISPFTLRRLKKTVLSELPPKIEDIRFCRLSEDQVKLYRDAISSRGAGLVEILTRGEEPVPYIHIFALLNLLKQICNHPCLVEGKLDDCDRYQSGKWELFKELVSEAIDSGQKVVVYSQYLGMIQIIENFLFELGVGCVTLTGTSRNRGKIVSRFNNDPDCRVYVGSLKAGGMGIDLVAASVVIHYDRWWNAAKEDQATDRVHRIGQKRGVQVFKLVTSGTLEEKISVIIEKKKKLMESVVKEDDPGLLKTFSREELINLLSSPEQHDRQVLEKSN